LISGRRKSRWAASALGAAVLVAASCLTFAGEGKALSSQSEPSKKKSKTSTQTGAKSTPPSSSTSPTAKSSTHGGARPSKTSAARRRRTPKSSRQRLAALRLDPERVAEIQQALIREGYLKVSATGAWDEATREAMRRYQADNGFSATGLPDAKSLMKLGLGPHPLPEDVKPAASAQAAVVPAVESGHD